MLPRAERTEPREVAEAELDPAGEAPRPQEKRQQQRRGQPDLLEPRPARNVERTDVEASLEPPQRLGDAGQEERADHGSREAVPAADDEHRHHREGGREEERARTERALELSVETTGRAADE